MSERIASAIDDATKTRLEQECKRLEITKSKFLQDLIAEYFNPKVDPELLEIKTKLQQIENVLVSTNETMEAMADGMATVLDAFREEGKQDLAAFFYAIMRNPELLPDPDRAEKEDIKALVASMNLDRKI